MANKKNQLHKTERDILILLNRLRIPLSTNEVSNRLGISYVTANKYLNSLYKKELLNKLNGKQATKKREKNKK